MGSVVDGCDVGHPAWLSFPLELIVVTRGYEDTLTRPSVFVFFFLISREPKSGFLCATF